MNEIFLSDGQVDALNQSDDVILARKDFLQAKLQAILDPTAHTEAARQAEETYQSVFATHLQYVIDNPPPEKSKEVVYKKGFARHD